MSASGKNDDFVRSCNMQRGQPEGYISVGPVDTPKQIAISRENSTICTTDREGMEIQRCNSDGSNREVIVQA